MAGKELSLAFVTALAFASTMVTSCARDDDLADIKQFMLEMEANVDVSIDPLPPLPVLETFAYAGAQFRSPFQAGPPRTATVSADEGLRPPLRAKEYLERFPLDFLAMVGSFERSGKIWVLIQDPDGVVHRSAIGDHLGMDWGEIELISPSEITISEIVSNGADGWIKRNRRLEIVDS